MGRRHTARRSGRQRWTSCVKLLCASFRICGRARISRLTLMLRIRQRSHIACGFGGRAPGRTRSSCVGEDHKRSWPPDGLFYRATNPMVTDRQNNRQQGNTKNATCAPFPEEDQAGDQQHGIKQRISTDERHDRIEKRIGQVRIDEAKQVGVHRGSLSLNARTLKTFQSIDDYRADRMILELVASAQEAQLDEE